MLLANLLATGSKRRLYTAQGAAYLWTPQRGTASFAKVCEGPTEGRKEESPHRFVHPKTKPSQPSNQAVARGPAPT